MSVSCIGGTEMDIAPLIVPVQAGFRSRSSGRAVATTSSGTPRADAPNCSTKASIAWSAQCMSSKTSTVGPVVARAIRNRRQAASVSPG